MSEPPDWKGIAIVLAIFLSLGVLTFIATWVALGVGQ